jgi:hypothetical protein
MGSSNLLSAGGMPGVGAFQMRVTLTKVSLGVETDIQSLPLSMSTRSSVFKDGSFMWRVTKQDVHSLFLL